MTQEIAIGNLVKVVEEDTFFLEKCGEVVEIEDDGDEDGPIGVRFHEEDIPHYVSSPEECVVRFLETELTAIDEYPLAHRAREIYGSMFHSVRSLIEPFSTENSCMHWRCSKHVRATGRAVINVWGTVMDIDLCQKHFDEYNGMCCDVSPSQPPQNT